MHDLSSTYIKKRNKQNKTHTQQKPQYVFFFSLRAEFIGLQIYIWDLAFNLSRLFESIVPSLCLS